MSRKLMLLLGVVLLIVVAFGADAVSRVLFAPWSIGVLGRDTLTGDWVGSPQARQGAEYGLYLELEYRSRSVRSSRSRARFSSNLQGRATLCTPTGERYEYDVSGHASRSGTVEKMWLEYGDPSLSALDLRLSGKWRSPVLTLAPDANPFLPDGSFLPTRVLSSADPDDSIAPFDLSKGDEEEFEAICQRIRQ
jgi:hypothetical protein